MYVPGSARTPSGSRGVSPTIAEIGYSCETAPGGAIAQIPDEPVHALRGGQRLRRPDPVRRHVHRFLVERLRPIVARVAADERARRGADLERDRRRWRVGQVVVEDRAVGRILSRRKFRRQRRVGGTDCGAGDTRSGAYRGPVCAIRETGPALATVSGDPSPKLAQRRDVVEDPERRGRACATTRSSPWTTRSRIDVCGMFSVSGCQSSPSLNETYDVALGAGEEQSLARADPRARRSPARRRQAARRSASTSCRRRACGRRAASRSSSAEADDRDVGRVRVEVRRRRSASPCSTASSAGGVTSVQCAPPSRVTWTSAVVGAGPDRRSTFSGDGPIV